jgi:division protein CdvB (Snf7/Vps24/ESCRT-III family)
MTKQDEKHLSDELYRVRQENKRLDDMNRRMQPVVDAATKWEQEKDGEQSGKALECLRKAVTTYRGE